MGRLPPEGAKVDYPLGVGAAALLLLFVGIHNAWDNIAYHVLVQQPKTKD